MSQQQLMAMKLITMSNMELRDEIYRTVEENPALEIQIDKYADGATNLKQGDSSSRQTVNSVHTGKESKQGAEAAEKFQKMLENAPDNTETLQSHLLHQLNMTNLPENENRLCEKIIQNLDSNGYHILAPITLIEEKAGDTQELLKKCISIVQHFDPEGICCENFSESLKLQAELNGEAPELALFLLDGNLEMLKPPVADKVAKKILDFLDQQEKLTFNSKKFGFDKKDVSEEAVADAIRFIQELDPFPARNFGTTGTQYVQPDVFVSVDADGLVKVQLSDDTIPVLSIAKDFELADSSEGINGDEKDFVQNHLRNAKGFIETLEFRKTALNKAFAKLAQIQEEFFKKGPGNLVPLTQRKFAEIIEVHESTVSRIADSKFVRCSWGTFPVKYFFSNGLAVQGKDESQNKEEMISTDNVKIEIEKILNAQKPGDKKLSDQKIADMLAEKGISIARRTVSKYRAQLNIASSYER